ncbi:MAG: ATP-binding protein, partial [Tepidimonas sp.]|nr:ATP-binding protein [Tepidimonas sp.]
RMRDFLTRRQPRREPVHLEQVIRQALGLLRHACQRQGVSVELRIAPDLPHVLGDEVLLEQVLINLLRNALDAVERQPRPRIAVHAELDAGRTRIVVAVHDNGPGLQGRSFEELSQPLCSSKPDGLGLGLAICRSVVEAHGGAFEACASPLGGAQLTFGLPLAHQAVEPAVHSA